jgi:hypothetical protein
MQRAVVCAVAVVLVTAPMAPIRGFEPSARQIMEEVQRRSLSNTFHYQGRIIVRKANASREEKAWRYDRIGPPGKSKVLIRFQQPAEVRGVSLLVWNNLDRASDLWLYTPALGRHRRIAPQDRSAHFAGTDFSFEEFEESDVSAWDYSELREELESGEACWRITGRRDKSNRSQYDKYWIWISKAKMAPMRIDKWRGGSVERQIVMRQHQQLQGIWTPMEVEVSDLLRDSTTTLQLTEARYDVHMTEADFTLEAMKAGW